MAKLPSSNDASRTDCNTETHPPVSKKNYEEHIKVVQAQSGYHYMLFYYPHMKYLEGDGTAAVLLDHLLNLIKMKNENKQDRQILMNNGLWFKCPVASLQSKLGMKWDKTKRALTTLQEYNLIFTEHRQNNAMWVKINTELLDRIPDLVEEGENSQNPVSTITEKVRSRETRNPGNPETRSRETRKPDPGKPGSPNNTNKLTNKLTKSPGTGGTRSVRTSNEFPDWCYEIGDRIINIIREMGRPPDPGTRRSRGRNIYELWKNLKTTHSDRDPQERIESLVAWFGDHWNDDQVRIPDMLNSIPKFVRFFDWLEKEYKKSQKIDNGW